MRKYSLACVIEKDDDGYIAYCPKLQGCYVQGDSYEEAVKNLRDSMKLHIEDRQAIKAKRGRKKGTVPFITYYLLNSLYSAIKGAVPFFEKITLIL